MCCRRLVALSLTSPKFFGLVPHCPNTRAASGMQTPTSATAGNTRGGDNTPPIGDPSSIPEMFGDTMPANGTVYPEATIEGRRYRLRILNATQARFLSAASAGGWQRRWHYAQCGDPGAHECRGSRICSGTSS